jgi:hypothetical protein
VLADLFALAHGAARAMRTAVEGLEVDAGAMGARLASGLPDSTDRPAALAAAAAVATAALQVHDAAVAAREERDALRQP